MFIIIKNERRNNLILILNKNIIEFYAVQIEKCYKSNKTKFFFCVKYFTYYTYWKIENQNVL